MCVCACVRVCAIRSLCRAHLALIRLHVETDGHCAVQGAACNVQHLAPFSSLSLSPYHSIGPLLKILPECVCVFWGVFTTV